jgi:hypothetical protein
MEKYDKNIITTPIIPPIGRKYHYAGKVESLYYCDKNKRIKIDHDFGETWGITKEEAIKKMEEIVKEWIEKRSE